MQGLQVQYLVGRTKILHVTAKKKINNRDKEWKTYLFSYWISSDLEWISEYLGINMEETVAMNINFHLLFKDVFLFKYIVIWYNIISPYLKKKIPTTVDVVQSLSHVWLFETSWTAADQAPLSLTISQSLLKLMSIGLMMLSNHLILCCPLLLLSIFPTIRVASLVSHQWAASAHQMAKELEPRHQSFQWIFRVDFL